ncbi:hypothetical protein, conserved [Eimeria praecox]|uniref:Uncharacterized protein n=1 Tax=Eimeria praecox TaxID=51316 RepID=U6H0F3_9EIME|nr:hypothetical protein, conserved [Eimeria praecox]
MGEPLLGAAEERQLFAADEIRAIMQWPPGYSVDTAEWTTETNDAFSRSLSHYSGEFLSIRAAATPAVPLRSSNSNSSSSNSSNSNSNNSSNRQQKQPPCEAAAAAEPSIAAADAADATEQGDSLLYEP